MVFLGYIFDVLSDHKGFRLKGKDGCLYKAENGGSSPPTSELEIK